MTASDIVTLTGELPAGPFVPSPAVRDDDRVDIPGYRFDGVTAHGVVFTLDEVMYLMSGSEFEDCVFRQDPRITKANRERHFYSYGRGNLGHERRSYYRNCTFDRVDFGIRGGGYTPDDARFEGCTFNRCDFRDFTGFKADIVDCTFVGTIKSARFCGQNPPTGVGIQPNVFSGNDFSQANLRNVEFRYGVDLRTSRLPDGQEYLRIDDFPEKAQRALAVIAGWPAEQRGDMEPTLRIAMESAGPVFFIRRGKTHYARTMAELQPLLESV